MQDELLSIQAGLAERNTILFITHDLNEALRVGTRVCIMKTVRSTRSARLKTS